MRERVGEEHQSVRPSFCPCARPDVLFEEMGMEGFDGG